METINSRPLLVILGITIIILFGVGIPFSIVCYVGVIPETTSFFHGGVWKIFDNGTMLVGILHVEVPPEVMEHIEINSGLTIIHERSVMYGERVHYFISIVRDNGKIDRYEFATEWVK